MSGNKGAAPTGKCKVPSQGVALSQAPPCPAGTSGSCPPTASQPRSRPSQTSGSHSVAHGTHLRHPLEALGGCIIPPLRGRLPSSGCRVKTTSGGSQGGTPRGQRWRGNGFLRDRFHQRRQRRIREVTLPPYAGTVNPSQHQAPVEGASSCVCVGGLPLGRPHLLGARASRDARHACQRGGAPRLRP